MYACYSPASGSYFDDGISQILLTSHTSSQLDKSTSLLAINQISRPVCSHRTPSMVIEQPAKHYNSSSSLQCLRVKYFVIFFVCTTCLALLAASLASQKWLVSKPIRIIRHGNGSLQTGNTTSLMLVAIQNELAPSNEQIIVANVNTHPFESPSPHNNPSTATSTDSKLHEQLNEQTNKFQGRIHFGLFSGLKVLNYGFGDRVSQLTGE
jgi:hypothetical protein